VRGRAHGVHGALLIRADGRPPLQQRPRHSLLSSDIFDTLAEVRYLVDRLRLRYNHERIQRALSKMTLAAFSAMCACAPLRRLAPPAHAAAPKRNIRSAMFQQLL